ncbi:hypothetical protein PPROV_000140900 [Pycnococcus provasolii]|uniref:Carbohydrate kinase PfkB domain-containing protein n=1 Tax=Pycnococcus provasolii TaxID=41880 RepID=A0A830H8H9_9CHLO|nr:hypothetical protein PPROV_000140900 [Pycnococcus provasolii]
MLSPYLEVPAHETMATAASAPPPDAARSQAEEAATADVVVFGSAVVDLVFRPDSGLPAPGMTVLSRTYETHPGGKGANQALAAHRAGAQTSFYAAVGRDAFADLALSNLTAEGVDVSGVRRDAHAQTACACVCVSPTTGENMIVVGNGANETARATQIHGGCTTCKMLVMQSEVPLEENERAAMHARSLAQEVQTLWNAAPAPTPQTPVATLTSLLLLSDHLVVNEHEAVALYNLVLRNRVHDAPPPESWANDVLERAGDDAAPENGAPPRLAIAKLYSQLAVNGQAEFAAFSLARRFGCIVCVTLGSGGASVYTPAVRNRTEGFHRDCYEAARPAPAPKRMHADPPNVGRNAIVDTVGAGDAFVGAYAAALSLGTRGSDALRIAVCAGTRACLARGAQASPTREDLLPHLDKVRVIVDTKLAEACAETL